MALPPLGSASEATSELSEGAAGSRNLINLEFEHELKASDAVAGHSSEQSEARFPFGKLPTELKQNVLEQAAVFEHRPDAHETIQNFRQASHASNDLIINSPLRAEAAALQRYPRFSREDAAHRDFEGGMTALEAISVNHLTGQGAVDGLKVRGARRDFKGSMPAPQALSENRVLEGGAANVLKLQGARRDIEGGMSASQALSENRVTSQSAIDHLKALKT